MKVFLRTFGCRANHADSEAVRAMLVTAGHEVVDDPRGAEAAVFNSCAVTADAEADLRQAVRGAARAAPGIRSVVMGCVAGLDDRAPMLHALPGVRDIVPGADLAHLASVLGIDAVQARAVLPQSTTRAHLRIQDGCDEHCTFCATTLARGANRSRGADDIVRDAQALADAHAEIVLTGIHIGTWGRDIGGSLGALVERLVCDVPGVRFRLSSIEATEVDERLGDLLSAHDGRVAPHLHAPLQSGSDRVLRRMGRHWYSAAAYAGAVERLASRCVVRGLGADVIVGFPGETAEDHAATVALCEHLPFTYLHVFPYSPRPGTAATRLGEAVPAGVVRDRAAELRAIGARKQAAHRAARAGGRADVVVLGGAGDRSGLTEDFLTVRLANPALPRGHRFDARLEADAGSLVAR